jgi:hypothetical protein
MLILEYPHSSERIVMLARQNGSYERPVIGAFIDIRVEDFMPLAETGVVGLNFVAQLPNSRRYLVSTFNSVQTIDATEDVVNILLAKRTNDGRPVYVELPSSPESTYWHLVESPWWEWAAIYDDHNGFVKAPKLPREGEPTPEEIDERLDEFPENRGKIDVLSPETLEKWATTGVTEDYRRRLDRI